MDLAGCFRLLCEPQKVIATDARRHALSLLTQVICLVLQAECRYSLETASLHGAAPLFEWAGAQPAFSSPIEATDRAVMMKVCALKSWRALTGVNSNRRPGLRDEAAFLSALYFSIRASRPSMTRWSSSILESRFAAHQCVAITRPSFLTIRR